MLKLNASTKFKKDYKLCLKRGYNMILLQNVLNTLRIPAALPLNNRDHNLSGNHSGERECHIRIILADDHLSAHPLYLILTHSKPPSSRSGLISSVNCKIKLVLAKNSQFSVTSTKSSKLSKKSPQNQRLPSSQYVILKKTKGKVCV